MSVWRDARYEVRAVWVVLTFALVCFLGSSLAHFVLALAHLGWVRTLDDETLPFSALPMLVGAAPANWACWRLFGASAGLVDQRWAQHAGVGLAFGAVAITLATVVPAAIGATTLRWSGTSVDTLGVAGLRQGFAFLIIALGEELALRGVAFWAIARGAGNAVAVLVTGGVFGALHLLNPSATWLAAGIVALVGVWFGVLTARTGSLWCAIGLHLSWNFCESFVFGQPVSGLRPGLSLLSGTVGAAGFWSGGGFGPEAAGWTALLLAAASGLSALWPAAKPLLALCRQEDPR